MDAHRVSPLQLCVAEGNAEFVSLLAAYKANLSLQDSRGKTPLHRAVELKQKEIVQCLLKQGADPNTHDDSQTTPLLLACGSGRADLVQLLCECRADLRAVNFHGQTCLHVSIASGHLEVVRLLLQRLRGKCDLLQTRDHFGQTVLHEAAKLTDHQFVEELLCQGCSTEVKDVAGMMPLHVASRYGGYQTVLKLAETTSDINAKTPDGKTAVYIASEFGNRDAIDVLVKMGADVKIIDVNSKNSLMVAASGGFSDIVNDLIAMGVQVDHKDQEHNTALHHACLNGRLATVKTLLEHRACVSITNIYGQTALAMAVETSKSEVAAMLMEHSSWEESLSVPSRTDCIFNKMIENTPRAVQIVLDKCVKTSDLPAADENYAIEFNFKYINSPPMTKSAPECVFVTMLRCGREDLLSHPLCQSNLSYKWYTYGKASFLIHALIQIGFLVSLTTYYFFMPRPRDNTYRCKLAFHIQYANLTNETLLHWNVSDAQNFTGISSFSIAYEPARFRFGFMQVVQYILYAFMTLQITMDLYSCFAVGLKYVKSFHLTTQTIICLLVVSSTIPFGFEPCDNQWRFIAYALFIFFVKTSVTCQSIEKIGILFTMFMQVAKTILKISILMVFFIPALSIPLSIMMNEEGFKSPFVAPFSTFAMALGELNFRETYVMENHGVFALDVYLMFPVLCLLLNCSLMNLMIGVAVGDIAKVEKTAYLIRLKAHIHHMIEAEQLLFFVVRRKLQKNKLVVHPNCKTKSFNDRVKRTFLYCEQISFIKKNTESNSLTERELTLVQEMKDQRAILDKLTKTTDSIMDALQTISRNRQETNDGRVGYSTNSQNTTGRQNDGFVKETKQN